MKLCQEVTCSGIAPCEGCREFRGQVMSKALLAVKAELFRLTHEQIARTPTTPPLPPERVEMLAGTYTENVFRVVAQTFFKSHDEAFDVEIKAREKIAEEAAKKRVEEKEAREKTAAKGVRGLRHVPHTKASGSKNESSNSVLKGETSSVEVPPKNGVQ